MPDIFKEKLMPVPHRVVGVTQAISMFSSFVHNPSRVSFQTQEEDEQILLFLRAHFITNFPWIILILLLVLTPFAAAPLFSLVDTQNFLPSFPKNYLLIGTIFYYLILCTYAIINFMTWFYNITLVTQKRIIDIDFSDLVYHDVAETKHPLLEDVNFNQAGFLASLFNYGDVFAQTAGGKENIEALRVPNPAIAAQTIARFMGKEAHRG